MGGRRIRCFGSFHVVLFMQKRNKHKRALHENIFHSRQSHFSCGFIVFNWEMSNLMERNENRIQTRNARSFACLVFCFVPLAKLLLILFGLAGHSCRKLNSNTKNLLWIYDNSSSMLIGASRRGKTFASRARERASQEIPVRWWKQQKNSTRFLMIDNRS